MGDSAAQILIHNLPKYVQRGLFYRMLDHAALQQHVHTVEDSVVLRDMLPLMGLVAFVGNGAILPRYFVGHHCGNTWYITYGTSHICPLGTQGKWG